MNKAIEIAVMALGGVSLFVVAFFGFAAVAGVPSQNIPLVGSYFSPPEMPEGLLPVQAEGTAAVPPKSDSAVIAANISVIDRFDLPPPLDADELTRLANELKTRKLEYIQHFADLEAREETLKNQTEVLGVQFKELVSLRDSLEKFEQELVLREEEADRVLGPEDQARTDWGARAGLFATGDVDDLVPRLIQYEPSEVAQILRALDDDRAALLLNTLPTEKWKEYVDAYSATE